MPWKCSLFSNIGISIWCLSCTAPPFQCDLASPWEQWLREQTALGALLMRTRDRHLPRLARSLAHSLTRLHYALWNSQLRERSVRTGAVDPEANPYLSRHYKPLPRIILQNPSAEMSPWEVFADLVKKNYSCSLQIVIYFYQKKKRKELKVIKRIIIIIGFLEMWRWSSYCTEAKTAQSLTRDLSAVYESALNLDIDIILRANSQFNKVMEILLLMSTSSIAAWKSRRLPLCRAGRPAVPHQSMHSGQPPGDLH